MDLFSTQFFAALAAIVILDLVLAGDNAIVIALAARNLPTRQRTLAIAWGTVGAIAVRAAMTAVVVWLLRIPGLLLFGGLMLIFIAYRLLVPKRVGAHGPELRAPTGMWAAMGTIVVADAMMGLDNVLAVAGAAHGSYLLVVLGLVISIPIVVWGSQLVLMLIDRLPALTYVGAGVLALTAAKMITDEPAIKLALSERGAFPLPIYIAIMLGVLALAFLRNRFREQDRLEARLLDIATQATNAGSAMTRLMIPIDGSENALAAVRQVANQFRDDKHIEIHLVNVQSALSRHVAGFLRRSDVAAWHRDEGLKALGSATRYLSERGLGFRTHIRVGERANEIARLAEDLKCDRIVMATARKNSLTRLVHDSVTNRLLELTRVPVEVIAGRQSSPIERYGIPAGVGAMLLFLAAVTFD